MAGTRRPRITIIGAGNVASHLAPALDAVADVVCVFSRSADKAGALAAVLRHARAVSDMRDVDTDVDYIIVSVADDAVAGIVKTLAGAGAVVAHTSGSVPMQYRGGLPSGVFYPLQTFSRDRKVDVGNVPFFIEGDSESTACALEHLAGMLSRSVKRADSNQRAALHIAAVFACNFANQLWAEADSLLKPYGYDITVFAPLLRETLDKAMSMGPKNAQTGPAVRGDVTVLDKHRGRLDNERLQIYDALTRRIIMTHKK